MMGLGHVPGSLRHGLSRLRLDASGSPIALRGAACPRARPRPRSGAMRRPALRWLMAVSLGLFVGPALACPVCAPGAGATAVQAMIDAEAVLIVALDPAGWRTVVAVKGVARQVPEAALRAPPGAAPASTWVVALDALSRRWTVLGPLAAEHAPWLRRIAATATPSSMDEADWREHVAFHLPWLEHADPFVAATAYGEIARAPYAAMRSLAPRLDGRRIERWLDDPALAHRVPLYALLLGLAGGPRAIDWIDRQVRSSAATHDPAHLGALLVADLELRGPSRVDWIERTWLAGRGRAVPELQAALSALAVQGGADAAVPRARAVDAFRGFVRTGHPLAGSPAPDLLAWRAWGAVPEYVALLKAGVPQHPASTYAILSYLDAAPQPEARAAAAAARAAGR